MKHTVHYSIDDSQGHQRAGMSAFVKFKKKKKAEIICDILSLRCDNVSITKNMTTLKMLSRNKKVYGWGVFDFAF
jgi:hypothetical protein